ncbi:MAG: DoxX family protein [Propionivibrio sp.]|uniref:DoxX family protein n=1 Tax=Propionivibrio sp. TaxID=2212460 RepID=UPI0025E3EABB|nr:DoxX family protein [Propionivibrio sp.]MBK7355957.1 DoxX family protein [Propionivibrio sp.]MBK8400383.1 DoxX family protein [Propionivibrio sp.]MBL0209183.1 DoxX family protein [Propionivibrio sp.]
MNTTTITKLHNLLAQALDALQPLFLLMTRWYVSWQFLKSGWLKFSSWQTTLSLFRDEYHVPVLPPELAAVVGTFGELFFPVLLVLGLGGRIGALGLSAVNLMAVISYAYVLLAEGSEAALAQHVLWGFMLVTIALFGNGSLALERFWFKNQDKQPLAAASRPM